MKKKYFINFVLLLFALTNFSYSADSARKNNLRTLFINNQAIIYQINIRTFGAKDNDGDEIIDVYSGDEKGTFINAIPRLQEISDLGFNTIYIMPVTKTGKLKALGTAGSLYAMDSFDTINPQFDDIKNNLTAYEEAKKFIEEAHNKNLNIIIDMPCAGSYDLSLKNKELFLTDKNGQTVVPADWTDVRLFKIYNEDKKTLNKEVLEGYKSFVDMVKNLGADGIRADVAGIKPKEFWVELINYARRDDNEFLFLAEASPAWKNPVKSQKFYTDVNGLLEAGFDGYYGEYGTFGSVVKAGDFEKILKKERKILSKFNDKKSTIASFVTHDVQSPTINGDKGRSELYTWLNVTLPVNSYFLDGYLTGDNFLYSYKDKKAKLSETDDDYYFAHKGKMDIFNFSRAPGGKYGELYEDAKNALRFKNWANKISMNAKYKIIKTKNNSVLAYGYNTKNETVIVFGNLDEKNSQKVKIKVPNIKNNIVVPIKYGAKEPNYGKKNIATTLKPSEIQVYLFTRKSK